VLRRRALGSVLVFIASCVACVAGYLFLLSALAGGATRSWASVVPAFCLALALLALNTRFLHHDGLSLASLGLAQPRRRIVEFFAAFLAGAALVMLWAGALALASGARWESNPDFSWTGAFGLVAFTLLNNAAEELTYRGWLFLRIETSFGATAAVIAPTLIFAAAHVQGGVPWPNAIAGVLTTGAIFALLFHITRSLPLVLGFHVATNLCQEALGLRIGPATVVLPHYHVRMTDAQGYLTLGLVASVNLIVVLMLCRYVCQSSRASGVADSPSSV
jgi:membrane protease YdiL (CAAX protease family)